MAVSVYRAFRLLPSTESPQLLDSTLSRFSLIFAFCDLDSLSDTDHVLWTVSLNRVCLFLCVNSKVLYFCYCCCLLVFTKDHRGFSLAGTLLFDGVKQDPSLGRTLKFPPQHWNNNSLQVTESSRDKDSRLGVGEGLHFHFCLGNIFFLPRFDHI